MLELYELINTKLSEVNINVFANNIPPEDENFKVTYPCIVFKFPNALPNGYGEYNLLEVDVWNNKATDVFEIETLITNIDKKINKVQLNNEKMQVCIYRNTPYYVNLPDTDANMQRRQLRYFVKIYYK